MDNAGSHGKNEAIYSYTKRLKDTYIVKIIHQVSQSPYFNEMDLGVCYYLYIDVEKQYYMH